LHFGASAQTNIYCQNISISANCKIGSFLSPEKGVHETKTKNFWFKPKITETGSVSHLFRFIFDTNENLVLVCITKQTVLFQNEPKQTENDLKNIKSKKNFRGIKKFMQISICELSIFMDCRQLCYLQSVKISL